MASAKGRGFAVSGAFESYKALRQRELALHRLAVEVVAMHGSTAANMSKPHRRLLEDIRDLCGINSAMTEAEAIAADSSPEVEAVRKSGVATHREPHFDGVDDVPLDAVTYAALTNVVDGDDSVVQVVPGAASTSSAADNRKKVGGNAQVGGTSKASLGGAGHATGDPLVADATSVYLKDVRALEKNIQELCKEAVLAQTSLTRLGEVRAQLNAKREQLVAMKATIQRESQ